jgi:CBS domain-containing protein
MLAKELLKKKPSKIEAITAEATIDEILEKLVAKKIGCLLVTNDNGNLIGIVSEKDVLRKIHEVRDSYHTLKAEEIMSVNVVVALPDDHIDEIAEMMQKNWIRHIPIVEDDEIVGLISSRDINRTLVKNKEVENRFLQQFMDGIHMRDMSGDL